MTTDGLIARLPPAGRVLVIRLRSLGDCVLSTPAIHLLKQHRPDLKIAVVAEAALADIFAGNPDLNATLNPTLADVRAFRPNLCINFHGGTRSAGLTLFSGASHRAAYDMLRFQFIYNTHIPTAQRILEIARPVHTAEHMASAMFFLGVPPAEIPPATIYPEPGPSSSAPETQFAILHPGASRPDKIWPAHLFRRLAKALKETHGLEPVFIGGPNEDLTPFHDHRTLNGLPLRELARLTRDAAVFIGNDSGPAHIAAAVRTPTVVLFGPSSSVTWGPWKAKGKVVQASGPIDSIPVAAVLHAIAEARQ